MGQTQCEYNLQATIDAQNSQSTQEAVRGDGGREVTSMPELEPEPPPLVPLPEEANNPTGARLICTRPYINAPCYDDGQLNFRATPCYIESRANIIRVLSNYTRVELIEQSSLPSNSGCDSSVRWYHIRFEGQQGFISSGDKYSRTSK